MLRTVERQNGNSVYWLLNFFDYAFKKACRCCFRKHKLLGNSDFPNLSTYFFTNFA